MHWIYLIHKFHNLSRITEINELFHDILVYWDAPVYTLSLWHKHKSVCPVLMFTYYATMQVTNKMIAPPEPRFKKRQFSPEVLKEERLAQGNTWLNNGGRHSCLPLKTPRGSSGIQYDLSWWKCRKWYFNNIVMTFQYKRQYKNCSEAIHSIRGSKRQLLNRTSGRDLSPVSIDSKLL